MDNSIVHMSLHLESLSSEAFLDFQRLISKKKEKKKDNSIVDMGFHLESYSFEAFLDVEAYIDG